jgi:hypothetical protein
LNGNAASASEIETGDGQVAALLKNFASAAMRRDKAALAEFMDWDLQGDDKDRWIAASANRHCELFGGAKPEDILVVKGRCDNDGRSILWALVNTAKMKRNCMLVDDEDFDGDRIKSPWVSDFPTDRYSSNKGFHPAGQSPPQIKGYVWYTIVWSSGPVGKFFIKR